MADEVAASTMVTYFTSCMAQLRGRAVYVQFSNHKELKTDQTHSNAVSPCIFIIACVSGLYCNRYRANGRGNSDDNGVVTCDKVCPFKLLCAGDLVVSYCGWF
jgi:polypyrimidine tract-binding protein 2